MLTSQPVLQLKGISKRFAGERALDGVDFAIAPGEIVAIIGENGAGKSTLLKILGGIFFPDEGEIWIDGRRHEFQSVRDADRLGIRLIHQELNLAEDLSIAENVFLGRQPHWGPRWFPLADIRTMNRKTVDILRRVGLQHAPQTSLRRLSVAQRQMVEIAKALSTDGRIIVFDEPTSSLSTDEANRLHALIEQLRDRGASIVYVSHRLQEVTRLANRVVVLRDGRHVGTLSGDDISNERMVSLMIGRNLQQLYHKTSHAIEEHPLALEVRDLDYRGAAAPASFFVRRGEILGFAGLVGSGRTELANVLFGMEPIRSGEIRIAGRELKIANPIDARNAGIALVPEDRRGCGILLQMAIDFNETLVALPQLGRCGRYNRRAAISLAEEFRNKLGIVTPNLGYRAATLSGGNQQKVVLAKWLAVEPRVLIMDEPTRGVDIGAKSDIYQLIFSLASRGMGVMLISSEMEEIVGVCDRVIVMHENRIAGELSGSQITETAIMKLAVGIA